MTVAGRATDADIINMFEQLVEENDSTTTLDVKKALRDDDLEVYQSEVSDIIRNYVENATDDYDFSANGRYRTYFAATDSGFTSMGTFQNLPHATAAAKASLKKPQKKGDWTVTDGSSTETYLDMTLNQARYKFSQLHHVPYINVTGKQA